MPSKAGHEATANLAVAFATVREETNKITNERLKNRIGSIKHDTKSTGISGQIRAVRAARKENRRVDIKIYTLDLSGETAQSTGNKNPAVQP